MLELEKIQFLEKINSSKKCLCKQLFRFFFPSLLIYLFLFFQSPEAKIALERPRIPPLTNSKVPREIRQRYLDVFIDECLKNTSDHKLAFDMVGFTCT